MIEQLTIENVKNQKQWTGKIDRITLFCGPCRSGKTAAMEGARLALTNVSSVGSAVNKQALLTNGKAFAQATGKNIKAHWQYAGKRTHSIEWEGMEVKSIVGDCPVTTDDYWDLTGEQRWALVESVVGSFTEKAPESADTVKAKLKALQSMVPPPAYEGESASTLTAEVEAINEQLKAQRNAEKTNAESKEVLEKYDHQLELITHRASESQIICDRYATDEMESKFSDIADAITDWTTSPGYVFDGMGGTLAEVTSGFLEDTREKLQHILDAVNTAATFAEDEDGESIDELTNTLNNLANTIFFAPEDMPFGNVPISSGKEIQAVKDLFAGIGCHDPFTTPQGAFNVLNSEKEKYKNSREANEKMLAFYRKQLAELQASRPFAPTVEVMGAEAIIELTAKREELQAKLEHATSYQRWIAGMDRRNQEIDELTAEIEKLDKAVKEYQEKRAAYLDNAAELISDKANKLLGNMQLPLVKIEIGTSGKRPTLTAAADGVDIAVMSGMERVAYGTALLNAFQEMSNAKCPALFVEASEMDDYSLCALINGLRMTRTKGNVFLCHWSTVNSDMQSLDNFTCHVFGGA